MNMTPFGIVAVHGNGGGGFRFQRILSHIPESIDFEAVTLPGFAHAPRDPALQHMSDYATSLRDHSRLLKSGHAEQPVILLGTGIGGSFILQYMQQFNNVAGIILHAPVGTRLEERWFPKLMSLPGMTWAAQQLIAGTFTRPLFKRLFFTDYRQVPADYLDRFFDEYGACQVFGQMFNIISADWWEALQPRSIPTALLWGEKERILSVDQLDDYKKLLPHHVVRTVPDWDHFPMIEQPAAYAAEIVSLSQQLLAMSHE